MKHPEYDSPFELVMSDITAQMARNIDENCLKAVQRVGINVDKDKLLIALRQDAERYREAYANGYETGYEKRDDDIVRCKDCKFSEQDFEKAVWCNREDCRRHENWFCADGEKSD